jgi:DeoR/GlpR family transcriptional regulator of sugar metabolism
MPQMRRVDSEMSEDMARTRREKILEWLERVGAASYQELADFVAVSTMTVRRDVDDLNSRGLVIKTLGGVHRADAPSYLMETAIQGRMAKQRLEKQAIAKAAIELIGDQQTLFMDGSTTCLELAKLTARRIRGLTIITNSALTTMEIGRNRNNNVIGMGGEFDPNSYCYVGASAEDAAERFYVDIAFISTMGFLPYEGTFESTVANFRVKQILTRRSKRVVLLVDHSKFGQRALARVLDADEVDCVVTDEATTEDYLSQLADRGTEYLIAPMKAGNANVA